MLVQTPTSLRVVQIFPQRCYLPHMNGLETGPVQEVESFQKCLKMGENGIFVK